VLILVLGIVSIVVASFGFASYGLAGLVALPLGIVAWVLGHRDLIKMQAKAMDPEGRGLTQAGYVCGIVGTVFGALMSLCCAGVVIFFGVMMTMGAAAGK
jgi:hypothetical protein